MRVSALQMHVETGDVRRNFETAWRLLEEGARRGSHLMVLPEMWSTGFAYPGLVGLARDAFPATVDLLVRAARRFDADVVGSIPEVEGEKVYNTLFWVEAGGAVTGTYRKVHLFAPMGEPEHVSPGDAIPVFASRKLGMCGGMICYDVRFPEVARRQALEGARLLAIPAQFPEPREEHWELLVRARALENQLVVVACNRVGDSGGLSFFGRSLIVGPDGRILAAGGRREEVVTADVDDGLVDRVRREFPAFTERRSDLYGNLEAPGAAPRAGDFPASSYNHTASSTDTLRN